MTDIYNVVHSKYGYNQFEMFLMVLITGITNFVVIPAIIIIRKQRMDFQFYMSIFTLITSFMYHTLESVDCKFFIIEEGGWHRLDNVGSIVCFQMLFTQLSDLQNLHLETMLNYFGLFITFVAQAKSPWDLNYTVGPILLQLFICIFLIIKRRRLPKLNKQKMKKGLMILMAAVVFFSLSQDEYKDYLRFYHGMWHTTVGLFSFYIWQSKCEVEFTWQNFYTIPTLKESYYKDE
ncbi:unnamed protein product [Paramecium primaurelia]|uniref:Uncharacterized protein n=1 Tax=Paramecium primaurelia TaxID=5886 RepID=A0A8S1K3T5_PARPR|nr:unnamed protein product [Paramecium primaurelia]